MLKPLENRVVLRVKEEEEKSMGGIVLTSASQEKPQTAEVVAVGEGKTNHHGTLISPLVKVGDTVIFEKFVTKFLFNRARRNQKAFPYKFK